ncbi:MAG TPA: addiction module antidote protein [Rhodanobacteraceae bacterium]|nr:addiction module antidote protein [Rhodanobacteraceae bacterium]
MAAKRKIKVSTLPAFDAADYLEDEATVAEYLSAVIEENDPGLLAAALGDVAKARGMSDIAQASGLAREALYKALRPGAHPRFETVQRVCAALGLKLEVRPAA